MSRFIVMKRTRDLQGCFLGGKKASYTHAKFPCSWTFAPSVPARGILLRVPAAGCRWRPRRPHRDAVRPSRRLSARVADCRPAPERGGSGLETGLPSSHGAPPLARAQVKALAATGLTARPTLVDRPGASGGRLRVLSLSGPGRPGARAGCRMLGVSPFHGFAPAMPAMTKRQRMGPVFGKVEGDSG
jgi:hypothetical protein